jgi:hypothetical protein
MPALAFAYDRSTSSGRYVDVDGRLRIPRSIISASEINDYYGKELPGWQSWGLEPDRRYAMLRALPQNWPGPPIAFTASHYWTGTCPYRRRRPRRTTSSAR